MSSSDPLADFFHQYASFSYDPDNSASAEFYRLCDHSAWDRDDPERAEAYARFKNALTMQFNTNYGTDNDDLASWQSLCRHLGIAPIPDTLKRCREKVTNTHVNLVDVVDVFSRGDTATQFESVEALSKYTIATGKYFPRDDLHAGDLLKHLLRHIFNPSHNHHQQFRRTGGRGRRSGRSRRG